MGMLPSSGRPKIDAAGALMLIRRKGVDPSRTRFIISGYRGYFPQSMGPTAGNDRDRYDDGFSLTVTDAAGNVVFFKTYNGNTDPSGRKDGRACLQPGVYPSYKFDIHGGRVRQYPAICQRRGPVTVLRDGNPPRLDTGNFGINLHEGGDLGTSSLGCQTWPPSQWDEFYADAKREAIKLWGDRWDDETITYILFDMAEEGDWSAATPVPPAPTTPNPSPTPVAASIPADIITAGLASQAKWGIPASVSIAQWALESGRGQHMPAGSNNPFGIKARKGDPSVTANTREVVDGQDIHIDAGFRKFASIADAFDEHGKLLATAGAYGAARAKLPDADAFADALTGVYATDPNYGAVLKRIMRGDGLYQLNDPSRVAPVNATLRLGDTGPLVETLQGILGVARDGKFGPATKAAVIARQAAAGLTQDGIVGSKTWRAL